MSTENNIGVFIGSHGEEMNIGGKLLQKLEANPIDGVIHRIAHPEAVKQGQRYLSTEPDARQIMARYPGNPQGDPEEQAAYANLAWIKENNPSVVLDIHETKLFGSYCSIGRRTTKMALAMGIYLGYTRILVDDLPFFRAVPNSALLESSLEESDATTTAQKLYQGLKTLTSSDLTELPNIKENLPFYKRLEIMTHETEENTLHALEEIPTQRFFSPLVLSQKQRASLDIPKSAALFYGTWGHDNMSRQSPDKLGYTKNEIPRSECFGDILIEIAPPRETREGLLIFETN